ncbi:MAG: ATP-binding cassette domain-containing protein [Pontibacterium sp.]
MHTVKKLTIVNPEIRRAIFYAGIFGFIGSLLALALPLYALQVMDRVLTTGSMDTLWVLTLGIAIALCASTLLFRVRTQLLSQISQQFDYDIRALLLTRQIRANACYSLQGRSLLSDLGKIKRFFLSGEMESVFDLIPIPLLTILVFFIHPQLGGVLLTAIALLLLPCWFIERVERQHYQKVEQALAMVEQHEAGLAEGAELLEVMGLGSTLSHKVVSERLTISEKYVKLLGQTSNIDAWSKLVRAGLNVAILAFGANLVISEQITAGGLLAVLIVGMRAISPAHKVLHGWREVYEFRRALSQIEQRVTEPQLQPPGLPIFAKPSGELSVMGLVYTPPGTSAPAIKGISLYIKAGTTVAITGSNGAGKTTLVRLLVGLYKPNAGSITLGDIEVSQINRSLLGVHVGYVSQKAELLSASVADNISRFQPAGIDEVIAAAKQAGAHEMIRSLPRGYDTQIQGCGENLSGGQRQLICLARALFGNPALLVLDEPTSMLDLKGTEDVARLVARLKHQGITTILVSHQQLLLNQADHLLVMDGGRIKQSEINK